MDWLKNKEFCERRSPLLTRDEDAAPPGVGAAAVHVHRPGEDEQVGEHHGDDDHVVVHQEKSDDELGWCWIVQTFIPGAISEHYKENRIATEAQA